MRLSPAPTMLFRRAFFRWGSALPQTSSPARHFFADAAEVHPAGARLKSRAALPDYKIARRPMEDAIAEGTRFPWKDSFELDHDTFLDSFQVVEMIEPLLTKERIARIEAVCAQRTFNVLPIVERPYDLGNLAAVCRTADALGCGAVNVIRDTTDDRYKQSTRTSGGAEKWLDVQVFDSTADCLDQAKRLGFQIVVTHLRADAVSPGAIDWTRPTAVVFGNELKGVTEEAVAAADACITLPMDGFVESYNISVAAALTLWEARRVRTDKLNGRHGDLSPKEQQILKAVMLLRTRGKAKQWVSSLLRRAPPEWQIHRNKGNWYDKEFDGRAIEIVGQKRRCWFWDGECCWGEKMDVWGGGKTCRYGGSHISGVSTLNKQKLKEACERVGAPVPGLESKLQRLKELAV